MAIEAAIDPNNLVYYHMNMSDLGVEELPVTTLETTPEDALGYLMAHEGVELIPKQSEVIEFLDNFNAFYLPALQEKLVINSLDNVFIDLGIKAKNNFSVENSQAA